MNTFPPCTIGEPFPLPGKSIFQATSASVQGSGGYVRICPREWHVALLLNARTVVPPKAIPVRLRSLYCNPGAGKCGEYGKLGDKVFGRHWDSFAK